MTSTTNASARRFCEAKKRQGPGRCKKTAGWGTDHVGWGSCKLHGGNTASGRTAAAREEAAAEAVRLGVAIETDPHEALAAIVAIIAGQVRFLQARVEELGESEALTEDALHPTIRALNSVLDQWRHAAKAAADAGVAKRRADLDEMVVAGLSEAMRRAVADVPSLTAQQEDELLRRLGHHVRALDELEDWQAPRGLPAAAGGGPS